MKLILASLFIASTLVLTTISFQKAIGSNGVDNGKIILNTPDGYIVVGEKSSEDHQRKELLVYKTNNEGTVLWSKSYGGDETYVVNDAYIDQQQHLHLSSERYLNNRESFIYIELDETGNIMTSKPYDEGGNEVEPWAIAPTANGGNLVVGFTKTANLIPGGFYNASVESKHLYLLKLDANGEKIWSKKLILPQGFGSNAYDIVRESNQAYYILGQISDNSSMQNIVFKINENGTILWSKKINENNIVLRNIDLLPNGDLLLSGFTEDSNNSIDFCAIKLENNGTIQWAKRYGKSKEENCKGFTANANEIILTSTSKSFNSTAEQILVSSIDYQGNLNWTNKYGSGVLEDISNPIIDGNSIVFSGFSLRTENGAETLLFKINKASNVQHQVSLDQNNIPISTNDFPLNFETLNTNNFGGSYSISDTRVEILNLNSTNLNF